MVGNPLEGGIREIRSGGAEGRQELMSAPVHEIFRKLAARLRKHFPGKNRCPSGCAWKILTKQACEMSGTAAEIVCL